MKKIYGIFKRNVAYFFHNILKSESVMNVDLDAMRKELSSKLNICPVCGEHHFVLGNTLCTPLNMIDSGNLDIGGKILPLVPVTCENCGYTMFFNSKVLGCLDEK